MKRRDFVKAILGLAAVPVVVNAGQISTEDKILDASKALEGIESPKYLILEPGTFPKVSRLPEGYKVHDFTSSESWFL